MSDVDRRATDPPNWNQRYLDGQLPWDSGRPDVHLPVVIESHGLEPGKVLEIGCGTGTNAIWLAQQGYGVTGLDLSEAAISMARSKAAVARVACDFLAADFLADEVPGPPFELVYDRGCFHVFRTAEERSRFASRVRDLLRPDGIWHSLIGSTDGPPRDTGPPRHSAFEVASAVEPHFEILELRSTLFDEGGLNHARAWVLVARRRDG